MATLKGAFIKLDADVLGALPNIIVFQFNPEQLSRTPALSQPPASDNGAGNQYSGQQPAPPSESFSFNLRLDATDQLAAGNPIAAASGILPALSALELLLVPKSSLTLDLLSLSGGKKPHVHPPESLPTVLFFWGPSRILPVSVTSLNITETQYDTLLNPVRAEVTVNLQVLTPGQLAADAAFARGAYQYSQGVKEVLAALNLANTAHLVGSGNFPLPF